MQHMQYRKTKILAILFTLLTALLQYQTAQAGLAAAVIVQRTIINQCILQAEKGPADIQQLTALYGEEAVPYLYVKGLKIFAVSVKFENEGKLVSYPCKEFFPELAPIHFYKGDWNEVLANLGKEVIRLRAMEANKYGKHLSLK